MNRTKKSVPWWNEEFRQAVKNRNRALRQLKKHYSTETLNQYKRLQAVVRKTIRPTKRAYWRKYCNTIGRETQLSEMWAMVRKMGGVRGQTEMPVLTGSDKTAVTNSEKAELLAETLIKVHSSENLSVEGKQCREKIIANNREISIRKMATGDNLDLPINLFELKRAISNTKQSSPGKGGVCYSMLAHMEDSALHVVLRLFNKIWETGKIPDAWKQSVIVPILKPGKDASNPANYRPKALTSQIGKTIERIITERLTYFLENLLPHY